MIKFLGRETNSIKKWTYDKYGWQQIYTQK